MALTEHGLGGSDVDLAHRLEGLRRDNSQRATDAKAMAQRWAKLGGAAANSSAASVGVLLALAYPDRIARNRGGDAGFVLANGRGGRIDPISALAREPFLAVAELAGSAAQGRIVLAAALTLAEIEARFADRIIASDEIAFDPASASLRARRQRRLGAITLADQPFALVPDDASARLLAQGIARLGIGALPWTKALRQRQERVLFLRKAQGEEWPEISDAALAGASDWLATLAAGKTALGEITSQELAEALAERLPWSLRRRLEAAAPTHFAAPSGSSVPIDYAAEAGPTLSIRVQELFGLDRHPVIAEGRVPLVIELLSPAQRPVQVTRDLPGFWRGSYAAVKAEMKGRYPRHPWPDDPLAAAATRRAKPRAT